MEPVDFKPRLLDLSENRGCETGPGLQQVSTASQTQITICDEFWEVRAFVALCFAFRGFFFSDIFAIILTDC